MKYSTLWLSLLAAFAAQAAEQTQETQVVDSYGWQYAKEAKTGKWKCKSCESETGWFGEVGLGAGYADSDGSGRFRNWVPSQNDAGMTGALNTDLQYRGEGSRYGSFEAKDLGMERFGVAIEQGHYDGVRAKIGYSESPYYWSQNGLTAYSPGNPMVSSGSLDKFDKQVLRKKLSGGIAYTPKSPWRPYAEFSHEQKEGTLAFIQNNTQGVTGASFVPKPIDNSSTTLVKGGVSYLGQGWLVDFGYNGSLYRAEDTALYYGPASDPFANAHAYEPDNEFHQLSLSGQYNWDRQSLTGRVISSRATSDGGMNAFREAPVTQDEFHGEIETLQADAKWVGRFGRDLTLRAGGEYRDRDDKSDEHTLIGQERTQGDRTRSKANLEADYRLSRSVKLTGGYEYRGDEREEADREETDEHTLFIKGRYRPVGKLQLGGKLAVSSRDGSDWRRDSESGSSSPTLRQFHLADRDRLELRTDLGYQFDEQTNLTMEGWWAKDDYKDPDVGLTDGQDYGIDLTLSKEFTEHFSGHLFGNQQWIDSTQNHVNSNDPTWDRSSTEVRDEISTLGFGLVQKKAFDLELELGVDYSYSHGRGETDTTQSYSYSDVTSTQHRVEGYALYQLDEKNSLRWDLRYESFENADYLNTDDRQSLGDVDDDYDGYFTSVSWLYKF